MWILSCWMFRRMEIGRFSQYSWNIVNFQFQIVKLGVLSVESLQNVNSVVKLYSKCIDKIKSFRECWKFLIKMCFESKPSRYYLSLKHFPLLFLNSSQRNSVMRLKFDHEISKYNWQKHNWKIHVGEFYRSSHSHTISVTKTEWLIYPKWRFLSFLLFHFIRLDREECFVVRSVCQILSQAWTKVN